jgi:regulatory protein
MQKTITAIKKQKRNSNRVNIYLDDEFSFGLYVIHAVRLKIGQNLSDSEIDALQYEDQIESAFQKALTFLAYKPRTVFDVRKKLIDGGYSGQIVETILEKLLEKDYLNDQQYAENWIENKSINKPRGKKLVRLELKHKNIDQEIIEDAVNQMDQDEELAFRAAERYHKRLLNLEEDVFKRRLTGFLIRRGFSYSTVRPIVEGFTENLRQNSTENING